MKELIYSLLFIAIVKTTSAQEPAHIITRDYVDKVLKTLSSDEMAGRGISTPGIEKAAVFIESQFKNIGLKPLEGAKGYKQGFYVYQVKPGQTAIQINGKSIDPSNVITLVNNAGEINFDQTNSDGWIRIDPDKPFKAQLPPLRSSKKRLLVLVDQKFAADFKLMREFNSMGTIVQDKELNQPGSPAIILVLAPDTLAKDFSVSIKYDARKLSLHNIAGMIPGKSKATETVIISGHYDHLGILQPVGQDSIANGANDDASGVTGMLALARYYKKSNHNERTLIFIAFTAEEIGLVGSKYFSQHINTDKVVTMINMELIGTDCKFGPNTAFLTGYDRSELSTILQKNLNGASFKLYPDPYPALSLFYRSDNLPFATLGVPAHTFSTDQILTDKNYHTVKDEYGTLNTTNIINTANGIILGLRSIVNGTDTPARIPKFAY